MRIISKISVMLFCIVAPFLTSLSVLAQQSENGNSPKADAMTTVLAENVNQWKRQAGRSLLKNYSDKEFVQKNRQLFNQKSMRGGPGMDGGGGIGVITQNENVRLLDLAVADGVPLKNFDKELYEKQLLKFGEEVTSEGQLVSTNDFFSCGIEMIQRQENLLLKTLPKLLSLQVVFSNLPLEATNLGLLKIPFLSASGWTYEMSSLPKQALLSPSLDPQLQRPLASYANQHLNGVAGSIMKSQTLLISSQLYQLLPNLDRCALQVHEIFRFLSYAGGGMPFDLLTRHLTTQEIESLTVRVMKQEPIALAEIPAANLFRFVTIVGKEALMKMSVEEMSATEKLLREQSILAASNLNTDMTTLEILSLYPAQEKLERNLKIIEEAILEVGSRNPFTRAASTRRQLNQKLHSAPLSLREVMNNIQ